MIESEHNTPGIGGIGVWRHWGLAALGSALGSVNDIAIRARHGFSFRCLSHLAVRRDAAVCG